MLEYSVEHHFLQELFQEQFALLDNFSLESKPALLRHLWQLEMWSFSR